MNDFDDAARTWDDPEHVARSAQIAAAIAVAVPIPAGARALDYGCGTGLNTWPLAARLAHVTLADTSTGMLEVVRERIAERPDGDRFEAVRLDLTRDVLRPGDFDLVYAVMSLHHIDPLEPVLAQFAAGLRPGGWLAVADLDSDPGGAFHDERGAAHHGFDRQALGELIVAAGFDPPTFTPAGGITKQVDGEDRDFPLFLAVARRPD